MHETIHTKQMTWYSHTHTDHCWPLLTHRFVWSPAVDWLETDEQRASIPRTRRGAMLLLLRNAKLKSDLTDSTGDYFIHRLFNDTGYSRHVT